MYEERTKNLLYYLTEYLPQDFIERKVIIDRLYNLHLITENEKLVLSDEIEPKIISDLPSAKLFRWLTGCIIITVCVIVSLLKQ